MMIEDKKNTQPTKVLNVQKSQIKYKIMKSYLRRGLV